MQWIESNQGFIAVKEALGLAGEELKNKLCYHQGDEMVILKKFMEMDQKWRRPIGSEGVHEEK